MNDTGSLNLIIGLFFILFGLANLTTTGQGLFFAVLDFALGSVNIGMWDHIRNTREVD